MYSCEQVERKYSSDMLTDICWISREMEGRVGGRTDVQADIIAGKQRDRQI